MPKLGDIWNKPRKEKGRFTIWIWQACIKCGKERWVLEYKWKQGKSKYCHHCYVTTFSHFAPWVNKSGKENPNWKGGRKKVIGGYWTVKLLPDDEDYQLLKSMIKSDGYVLEHRLIMAKAIGRALGSKEIVHHVDGNRENNVLSNLELTSLSNHDLSYKGGYKQGFKDGMKYAQSIKICPERDELTIES